MNRNILKTLALTLVLLCFGRANAQSDLLAYNNVSTTPNDITAKFIAEEKLKISDFTPNPSSNNATISVNSQNAVNLRVKFFSMNGDLAKEESLNLVSGANELNVSMDGLAKGIYMVQFYSHDGSAVRRLVKMD